MVQAVEPRVVTIEGVRALVIERTPPLQSTLAGLHRAMVVTYEAQLRRSGGARAACISEQDHRLIPFLMGRHVGLDGIARDLKVLMCADCEAVQVRDVTYDRMARLPTGGQQLRRRDHVIGWYTGARPGQRQYR